MLKVSPSSRSPIDFRTPFSTVTEISPTSAPSAAVMVTVEAAVSLYGLTDPTVLSSLTVPLNRVLFGVSALGSAIIVSAVPLA